MGTRARRQRVWAGALLAGALLAVSGGPAGGASRDARAAGAPVMGEAHGTLVVTPDSGPRTRLAAAASGARVAQPQRQPVRLGIVETSSEVGIHLANERGYFTEQGLTPEYVRFESAAFAVAPLSTGEIEAASGVVSAALFNAINRGVELRIAAPQSRYEPGHSQLQLVLRRDLADSGALRDYADMRGRTLAINSFGSTVELLAERALERGGLTPADVNIVQLGFGDQVAGLANRAIELGLIAEPLSTVAVDRGVGVKWREAADWSPGIQVSNILFGPNYISRNPDAGQRFMVAYLKGVRDSHNAMIAGRGDREAVIDVMMRNTPLKDRALYDRMRWVYIDPNLAIVEDDLRATMQWLADRGLVDRLPDLGTVVDRRFAQYALSVLGPYQ